MNDFETNFGKPMNLSLILAAVSIVAEVYAPATRSPILIGQYANTKTSQMEQNDIMTDILMHISTQVTIPIFIEVDIVKKNFLQDFHNFDKDLSHEEYIRLFHKKDKAIWFVDSISSFESLKADLLNERFRYERNGFFCIIYTGAKSERINDILHTIFRQLFEIFIININILLTSDEKVYVYTYFPFTPNECCNTKPIIYDTFEPASNFKFKKRRFFSKKLTNMWGCSVKVTTWTEPPFIIVKYNEHTGSFASLEGIEGMLMMLLAQYMNFTMQLIEEPNHDRGYLYPNGTATGTSKMLINGETDIVVHFMMSDKLRQEFSDPAYSYLSLPFSLGIPKGKLMTPFERLYRPFKYTIWICLSSSIVVSILVIFILKSLCNARVQQFIFGENNRLPLTNLLNAFFGGSIASSIPRRNFARYLLAIWMLYTLLLRSAYIGQLFQILQDSRGRTTISTIEEAIKQNFTFYTYPVAVPMLRGATSSHINIAFVNNKENSLQNLFKRLGEDEHTNSAVTIIGHLIRYYNQNPGNQKRRVNILRDPIMNTPITFYMRKHSFLVYEINEILLNIMSAGLIKRFEGLYLDKHSISDEQKSTSISVWPLFGLFSIYICLLVLTFLVFLLELWSNHSRLTKTVIDFFNL